MSELRFNHLLGTYTIVASNRQNRPHLPKNYCPFCPGNGNVPDNYDVMSYNNDFPALSQSPDYIEKQADGFFEAIENYGKCEVLLYSPDHEASLSTLPIEKILKIVNLWAKRFKELSHDVSIKYIFEFENRGEEVGVTIHHPHGQLYAYPFIPLKIKTELDNCRTYYKQNGENLFDVMTREEIKAEVRMVFENESFAGYIPYFSDYPYGVFVVAKNAKGNICQFAETEKLHLAEILKLVTTAFDKLFKKPFPYMMCIHQTPVNCEEYTESDNYYRFHIEFYPPLRDADRIKWYASSEMGAWAATNTLRVEDCAVILRTIIKEIF